MKPHMQVCVPHSTCVLYTEPDCQVVWEKKPTPEEEERAKSLQLPPTFFCGLSATDSDPDHEKPEDFETEVRKAQDDLVKDRTQIVHIHTYMLQQHTLEEVPNTSG